MNPYSALQASPTEFPTTSQPSDPCSPRRNGPFKLSSRLRVRYPLSPQNIASNRRHRGCVPNPTTHRFSFGPKSSGLGTILLRKAKFPAQLLVEIARIGQVIFRPARPRAPLWLLAFVRFLLHLLYSRPNRLILSSSSSLQFR